MNGTVRIGLGGWNYPEWKDGLCKGMPCRAWLARAAGSRIGAQRRRAMLDGR